MQSERRFKKTTFSVTVVSEGDYNPTRLSRIAGDLMTGPVVGTWGTDKVETLSAVQAVAALEKLGADPDVFDLTRRGEDVAPYDVDNDPDLKPVSGPVRGAADGP